MVGTEKWYGNHPAWVLHASELQKVKESAWKSGTQTKGRLPLANAGKRVAHCCLWITWISEAESKKTAMAPSFDFSLLWLTQNSGYILCSAETLAEPNWTELGKFAESKHRQLNTETHGNQQQWRPHWRIFQRLWPVFTDRAAVRPQGYVHEQLLISIFTKQLRKTQRICISHSQTTSR